MLDPSLSPEEARSLFLRFLHVQYASLGVVLLGVVSTPFQDASSEG
jgi:hypothetical protein